MAYNANRHLGSLLSSSVAHLSSAEVCGKPLDILSSGKPERSGGRRPYRGCSVCDSSGLPADAAGVGQRECLGAQQPHRFSVFICKQNRDPCFDVKMYLLGLVWFYHIHILKKLIYFNQQNYIRHIYQKCIP